MINVCDLQNSSCSLFLLDDKGEGLSRSLVVNGTLIVDGNQIYFEKDLLEGFPVPQEWMCRLYATPAEQADLFRGCNYFIAIPRTEAEQLLEVFHVESRWGAWCPVHTAKIDVVTI